MIYHKYKLKVNFRLIKGYTKQYIDEKIKQLDYNEVEQRMYDRGGFIVSKQGGNTFLSATKAIIDHLT